LIDYAHTDKALEALLLSLREIVQGRIILVFGAGGSRDKTKRPRMGSTASRYADFVIVTSDNPRQEEPEDIIEDVVAGFENHFKAYEVEADRKQAIFRAVQIAEEDDMIVIAGKGHEDYQIFKDGITKFDDYQVALEALRAEGVMHEDNHAGT
jgi:UDP-N-acetylmuramoyl-L-alanyl-D-glutamate--2,6-diaminopimelate ligase